MRVTRAGLDTRDLGPGKGRHIEGQGRRPGGQDLAGGHQERGQGHLSVYALPMDFLACGTETINLYHLPRNKSCQKSLLNNCTLCSQ